MNKKKDDYFNFISQKSNYNLSNEDEKILFNAKKNNFFQIYKYEVNQMNTIIEENSGLELSEFSLLSFDFSFIERRSGPSGFINSSIFNFIKFCLEPSLFSIIINNN